MAEQATRRVRTRNALLPLAAIGTLAVGCNTRTFEATVPVALTDRAELTPLPLLPYSVIDAPITLALAPALAALERAVPTQFGDIDNRIANPSNRRQAFAFAATRTPFIVTIRGQHLVLETTVEYQGRGWYNPPLAPTVSAACGKGEERPRLRVVLSSDLALSPSWRLRSSTSLDTVVPFSAELRDQCRVTFISIDVTHRVTDAVRGLLEQRLPQVDRRLAAFDVRTPLDRWYNLLNKQLLVGDSLWLTFNPAEVHFGGLRTTGSALIADVRLLARPLITTGERPPTVTRSLPPLVRAPRGVGDSLRVMVDGRLGYDVATTRLQRALVGQRFTRLGRSVRIDSASLYGLGDGRVVLALVFRGYVDGTAYLVGTPQLDRANHMLTVPDLDFDVASSSALARGVAWLTRDDVVQELRRRAQLPLTESVDKVRERVEEAMNRDLARGVHLTGELRSGRLLDVIALEREVLLRFEITGSLALAVDRRLPLGRTAANTTQ